MADPKRTNDHQSTDRTPNTKDASAANDLPERPADGKDADIVKGGAVKDSHDRYAND